MFTVIFTHTDLDGVASASLYIALSKEEPQKYRILFMQPRDLGTNLKFIIRKSRNVHKIVIMDLAPNEDTFESIYKSLEILSKEIEIEWFDHHLWDGVWLEKISTLSDRVKLYVDRAKCTCGLVCEYFSNLYCSNNRKSPELEYARNLAEIVCDVDLWRFNRWESAFLYRYADFRRDSIWKQKVLRHILSKIRNRDVVVDEEIVKYVEMFVDKEFRELNLVNRKQVCYRIDNVSICMYMKQSDVVSSSIIGNYILSRGADIAIIIHRDLKALSFRSKKCNVQILAKAFGGGGHEKASGAPLKMNSIQRSILRIFSGFPFLQDHISRLIMKYLFKLLSKKIPLVKDACTEKYI